MIPKKYMQRNSVSVKNTQELQKLIPESHGRKSSKQRFNKSGTLQLTTEERKSNIRKGSVSSSIKRRSKDTTRSVSHADSPAIVIQPACSYSFHHSEVAAADNDDERILNALEAPPPENEERKSKLKRQLRDDDCSIDGQIEDIEEDDAPQIRKYLERYYTNQMMEAS